jgi:hypothetical protein
MFARLVRAVHFPDREAEREAYSQNLKVGEYLIANALCDAESISEQDLKFLHSPCCWKIMKTLDVDAMDFLSARQYAETLPRCLPKATIIKTPPGLEEVPEIQVKPDALASTPPVGEEAHKAYDSATRDGLGEKEQILEDLHDQIQVWEEGHIVLQSEGPIPLIEVICEDHEKAIVGHFPWKEGTRAMTLKVKSTNLDMCMDHKPVPLHLPKEGKIVSIDPVGFGVKQVYTCESPKSEDKVFRPFRSRLKGPNIRESSRDRGFFFERGLLSRQVVTNRR